MRIINITFLPKIKGLVWRVLASKNAIKAEGNLDESIFVVDIKALNINMMFCVLHKSDNNNGRHLNKKKATSLKL